MLTWTQQNPNAPGWYWMLSPSTNSNLPTIVQIVFDRETRRWLALIPASRYPKTSGKALELQSVDAVWAGPLEVPSVLATASSEMVSPQESKDTAPTILACSRLCAALADVIPFGLLHQ